MACRQCINKRDEVCNVIAGVLPLRVVYWCLVRMAVYIEHGKRPVGADNISLQKAIIITRAYVEGVGREARQDLT